MFIAFKAQNGEEGLRNPKHKRRSERLSRRGSTPRACTSCRRRKIKCDGEKPCEACRWYKKPELCGYTGPRSSQSQPEKVTIPSPDYKSTLERLFPDTAPENIANFSRDKLLDLMTAGGSQSQYSQPQDSSIAAASLDTHDSALSGEMPGLESLHTIPGEQLDEIHCASASESVGHISDDVNALSLSARHPTSYLGVSSIQAALKVIAWLHPAVNSYFAHSMCKDQDPQPTDSLPPSQTVPQPGTPPTEHQMLDAYFLNFQPFAPLIDEEAFRTTYLLGRRKDDRWLALLNIVLALGNITAAGADNHTHSVLEVVQALGLMGGWYCHYTSQPNLAYSLMGASLRMAVTLGLQREPSDIHSILDPKKSGIQEFKRRVWWSLCCLETWGHETLGRPSMDYFGPSITVNLPSRLDKESYFEVLPLTENVQFVKIALKIQESLAALPTLSHTEMFDLDSQLVRWWHDLPPVLKDYEPCPESLYAVRTVMRWRFYNHRMLLYRPTLLNYAMRRVPFMAIRVEERTAIQKCQEIAAISIQDISLTTQLNQMIGWNAVWMLFQATMVPLICLSASVADNDSAASFEACKTQVETAMLTLGRMKPYGHTAGRSLEVISGILESNLQAPRASPLNASGDSLDPQSFPPPSAFNTGQQVARDRVSDWTATSFETLSSQYMWEYLSWDHSNLWPEIFDLNTQNEDAAMSFLDSSGT
ncbi:Transcription factor, fungi [Penicillium expansum]|uniref:Transcription factor, fungi n=1 Tax=Penicillium expansum TaxID=27334 RepID=A0A0A2I0Q9_PENEN|nr:Transcription factor, fungi [Penicillium expansum]KGO36724.1 Transcription factor, fungi [Penicillium expansum]KGO44109.1 Transcription factor, fungi [Penicillium expansum]KGO60752.1 Transcription factor, fungi [Penicillium expansum]